MEISTLIGLALGFAVTVAAMLMGGSIMAFVDVPSLMVVMGGTMAVTMARFTMGEFLGSGKVFLKSFLGTIEKPAVLIARAVELATVARREGLLALEKETVDDPFFQKGLRMCVDGLEPEFVRKLLEEDTGKLLDRHSSGQKIFRCVGDAAPAMGMVGTLIGLVQMLGNMDDPKSIGPAMAVALLTTLYGSIVANLFALPIADKLEVRGDAESFNRILIIEAISSIQEGRNPRVMEQLLQSYLSPSQSGGDDDGDKK